ncbi:hypothetical protein ALQ77_03552 [Pseudomonas corrugata]|uniref:Dioxygenase n=1 Tax=Pseudomonas corrugata TaxID=47879 RepID=A0A3M3F188_9PSED|nr:hypothetical protein ALQ77_03552 [Pseudomonas corrugata]
MGHRANRSGAPGNRPAQTPALGLQRCHRSLQMRFQPRPILVAISGRGRRDRTGDDCHVIGQTAWRCHPGFIGAPLHLDYLPMALPPSLLVDPAFELPMQICTAQFYLDDIDADLSPTRVIPGSHRAGRAPVAGETQWSGHAAQPVLCRAGDVLVLRSELWHAGSDNQTADRTRYLLQVHYGRRMVAQKFSPYLHWQFNPAVLAAASPRQRRLLGEHQEAEYD